MVNKPLGAPAWDSVQPKVCSLFMSIDNPDTNVFIIGDIHGNFTLLYQKLNRLGFNKNKDLLICVGDLIDTGEESKLAREFLKQDYVYSVRGNHEELLIDSLLHSSKDVRKTSSAIRSRIGGTWTEILSNNELNYFAEELNYLPYVITVEYLGRTYGIVHANVPSEFTWKKFIAGLHSPVIKSHATWGKSRAELALMGYSSTNIRDLDALFVGHTSVSNTRIIKSGNTYFTDLGINHSRKFIPVSLMQLVNEGV